MAESGSRAAEVREAAVAVSALAGRVAYDSELASDLVEAQHARDVARIQELLHATGVPVKVAIVGDDAQPSAGAAPELRISGGISITHDGDGWSVSVTFSVSK